MATKKTFKDSIENPAEFFISKPEEKPAPETAQPIRITKPPKGYKINPVYLETRSKRLQILIQPSLLDKIRAKAKKEKRSVNDVIHTILEDAINGKE